jgi:hypothetical protein
MTNGAAFDHPARYRICVRGALGQGEAAWFEELEVALQENGETVLAGLVDDQAALHGLLSKIYLLKLSLISLVREKEEQT